MPTKRNKRWWYDFTIAGKRYRGPLPTARTKRDAVEQEDRIRISVHDGTFDRPEAITLGEFIDEHFRSWYETNHRNPAATASLVKSIESHFGSMPLRDISPLGVERFKRERMNTPAWGRRRAAQSVNIELAMLSKICSLAIEAGLIESNPVRKVRKLRVDNKRSRHMTPEEEEKLLAGCVGAFARLRRPVIIALNTGMRLGEICKLEWKEVDYIRERIHVRDTKTGKPREVPINRAAALALGPPDTGKVFDLRSKQVTHSFRRVTQKLEIEDLHFHDLRHTFATRLADAGVDPFTIAELLGHQDIRTTKRYTHALDRNKRAAVETLVAISRKSVTGEVILLKNPEKKQTAI